MRAGDGRPGEYDAGTADEQRGVSQGTLESP
jgi:hypothetical protein